MGLVSCQFHVKYDNTFESVKHLKLQGSQWQYKCHFISAPTLEPMLQTSPVATNEGGTSTYEGATKAQGGTQAGHLIAPLPEPLLLEPLAEGEYIEANEEQAPLNVVDFIPDAENAEEHPDIIPIPANKPVQHGTDVTMHRSNCTKRPSRCLWESYKSHIVQVMEANFMTDDNLVTNAHPLQACAASNDPDILMLKQAMQAEDADQFRASMVKEFNDHCKCKHWTFVHQSLLPSGTKVLPAVWAMR